MITRDGDSALEQSGKSEVKLKPEQEASIHSVFDGRDVYVTKPSTNPFPV